jgi:hypothetical protein
VVADVLADQLDVHVMSEIDNRQAAEHEWKDKEGFPISITAQSERTNRTSGSYCQSQILILGPLVSRRLLAKRFKLL